MRQIQGSLNNALALAVNKIYPCIPAEPLLHRQVSRKLQYRLPTPNTLTAMPLPLVLSTLTVQLGLRAFYLSPHQISIVFI